MSESRNECNAAGVTKLVSQWIIKKAKLGLMQERQAKLKSKHRTEFGSYWEIAYMAYQIKRAVSKQPIALGSKHGKENVWTGDKRKARRAMGAVSIGKVTPIGSDRRDDNCKRDLPSHERRTKNA